MKVLANIPCWVYRQSAVLPYRQGNGHPEVLLITSRKGTRWVLPKGIVEPGLTPQESAAKEGREEAGVEGETWDSSLGSYSYKKWGGTCKVAVFAMEVTEEWDTWPEAKLRRRAWFALDQAVERVKEGKLKTLIRNLPNAIEARPRSCRHRPTAELAAPRVIVLLRHAKSSWDDTSLEDFDRPLAPRGRRATDVIRQYVRLADVKPDLVLCSSARRTRETLKGIAQAFGENTEIQYEGGIYHADAADLMNELRGLPDKASSVMLIGHNPGLQDLALSLAGRGDPETVGRLKAKFPTAGLAILVIRADHWVDLRPAACELHSFVVPRELA